MANKIIPEELDALIQEYLTDGVFTDKERTVILRKAEGMGLDHDEIDLYLDAQVQKIDLATDAVVRRQKSKACPYCGAPVPLLTDKCPECGQFLTPQASEELQNIFDNLEEALVNLKSGEDYQKSKATIERYARKAKIYYSSNPKVQKLLKEIGDEMALAESIRSKIEFKNTIVCLIKNAWFWLLLELLFFCSLYTIQHFKEESADDRKDVIVEKMITYPEEYEKFKSELFYEPDENTPLGFAQLYYDYRKEWDAYREHRDNKYTILIFGFFPVLITLVLAIRKSTE